MRCVIKSGRNFKSCISSVGSSGSSVVGYVLVLVFVLCSVWFVSMYCVVVMSRLFSISISVVGVCVVFIRVVCCSVSGVLCVVVICVGLSV